MTRWLIAALTAGAIAAAGRWRRSLTTGGALAAVGVGTVVQAQGGLPAAGALVAFFVSSSALSRWKEAEKARRGVLAQAKGGERDAAQVLANGGVATAALVFGRADMFLGALATAAADTWATELGLLSRQPPRLITTLRPVQPGTSGAVTPQGTLAGVGGAALVAATYALLAQRGAPDPTRASRPGGSTPRPGEHAGRAYARVVLGAVLAGALGSLVDSLLGATVQAAYRCPRCGVPTETPTHAACGGPAELVRGLPFVTNDTVNLLATTAGAAAGRLMLR